MLHDENKVEKIFTFNASDFLLYPIMKSYFELSDQEVYNNISEDFSLLITRLSNKRVDYNQLKYALIPNQDKKRYEICLIFDTTQIKNGDYGKYIFDNLIPLLDKESTYSILHGDYIDLSYNAREFQQDLRIALKEVLSCCNRSKYQYSGQYYLIYFNRLTEMQYKKIVDGLFNFPWFTGYANITYGSKFKSYISNVLSHLCIKCKKQIIVPHPSDYLDNNNLNIKGYSYEENGFKLISINDESYGSFLSYKIESEIPNEQDVGFSFNALFPKFDSFEKVKLNIVENRWSNYLTDKNSEKGKGVILQKLGYENIDKERFIREIYNKIRSNYLYNLTKNKHGDLIFDVCVELPTVSGHLRRTTIALKYLPNIGEMQVVTIT